MKNLNIIVVHPAKQHSYRTAKSLIGRGRLTRYITTVYYKPDQFLYKFIRELLPKKYRNKLILKCDKKLDKYTTSVVPFLGFIYLVLMNIDKNKMFIQKYHRILENSFSNAVYKMYSSKKVDIIISYDTFSKNLFLKFQSSIKILDLTSCPVNTIYDILQNENKEELDDLFKKDIIKKLKVYSKEFSEYYKDEILLADYILVSSSHQKVILEKNGVPSKNIKVVHYGMNFQRDSLVTKKTINKKIKFLFVGRIEYAKGIYYLLEAFAEVAKIRDDWELNLVGECCIDDQEIKNRYKFCNFMGKFSNNEMEKIYLEADVFVLPSLWEGLSLSLLEALSFGIPAIVSTMSGGEDIIKNYENGILVRPADKKSLESAIIWFLDNSKKLPYMREKAFESSKSYTWKEYGVSLNNLLDEILDTYEEESL